jgi:hypothetical protein
MQWQVCTITPVTPYDDTKTYDIVLVFAQKSINIFSDIDVWTFNQKQCTNIGGLQLKLQGLTIR